MANSLLTINMITREAVRLFQNSNAFLMNIERQYDDQFANTGAKIGTTLRIRLPNDYTVRTGQAVSVQDTSEQSITLTLATQKGVDLSFSSAERLLSLDDFSKRVLSPAINNLAGDIAATIMDGVETGICNIAPSFSSGTTLQTPSSQTYLIAKALLDLNSTPQGARKIINDPITEARMVNSLQGLFNPQGSISKQYETGSMYHAFGFDWFSDQTVIKHQSGAYTSGDATVSGANQTGTSITTTALARALAAGDIITFENVFQVNRVTKRSTGALRQFVVTAAAAIGATSISIYPAIVPAVGGVAVQYQTVTDSPANGAAIAPVLAASQLYRKNFCYYPEAITMVTADLQLPRGTHEADRQQYDGISLRMITDYQIGTDQWITRLDVLFGYLYIRPEWSCIVPDII